MLVRSDPLDPLPGVRLRSGTAARLAGLPVTTLRVWERRYNVVAASKTATGQRVYSNHDVLRLRLLRQLTRAGHAIGSIATLELESLQALVVGVAVAPAPGRPRVIVVDRAAASKLAASGDCTIRTVFEDLDQAERAAATHGEVDVLFVRLASLQPAAIARVAALAAALAASSTVVLYAFGAESTADGLRDAGVTVRREPVAARELAALIRGGDRAPPPTPSEAGWQVNPRRFSDEQLEELAARTSPIACECLRHVSEIVMQLAAFERYSQDCTSRSPADTALHLHLSGMAGAARTLFERALQRVAMHDEAPAAASNAG